VGKAAFCLNQFIIREWTGLDAPWNTASAPITATRSRGIQTSPAKPIPLTKSVDEDDRSRKVRWVE